MSHRALSLALLTGLALSSTAREPSHFIFFNLDRHRIAEPTFLDNPNIAGAQLKFTWPELEPERDRYDFREVRAALDFLTQHHKQLFLQIQDVSFEEHIVNAPRYLLEDPQFHGGVARQQEDGQLQGWVARRWDPAVRERFVELLRALAQEFDGRIAGLNFAETSIGFGDEDAGWPAGYSPQAYYESTKQLMTAARTAFRSSHVILYANFMPGEDLPDHNRGYLQGIYRHAAIIGLGVGGPDLLPKRWYQRQHSLPLIAARPPGVVAGLAVQDGNLEDRDRGSGKQVTVEELADYARVELRLDYLFWGTQEPYYSQHILPYLRSLPSTRE